MSGSLVPVPQPVSLLGVAAVPEGLGLVAAAVAASVTLVSLDPRRRAWAMLAALVLAGLALLPQVHTKLTERPAFSAAGAVAGLVVVLILAWVFVRRPAALGLLALAALPFRVPVAVGGDTASLLIPLYAVTGAGALAYAATRLRPVEEPDPEVRDRRLGYVAGALAGTIVLYALQSLYSQDVDTAAKNVCFFYVPFAVLFRLLVELPWTPRLLRASLGVVTGLAVLFAAVGVVEYATGHLLLVNEKVLSANELEPYFRVNSLFFDPSVYGRYEALAIVVLAAALLWSRRTRDGWLIAITLALLWAGMVFSLSQSSFAALLAGLAVLTALRWRIRWAVLALTLAAVASAAVVAITPHSVGLKSDSTSALDKATSGRASLVRGAARMARDRPVWGEGSGSFAVVFKARERVPNPERAAVSHTIPLTVAAEQGAIGLIAYVALLVAAGLMLFRGLRVALRRHPDAPTVARAAVAAAFVALVVHTLVYAAYLEDPLAWALLALGAALLPRADGPDDDQPERQEPVSAPAFAAAKPV